MVWWIGGSLLLRDSHSKRYELLRKATSSISRDKTSLRFPPSVRAFDVAELGDVTVCPEESPFNRGAVLGASLLALQLD